LAKCWDVKHIISLLWPNLWMTKFTQIDLHVSHTNKSLNLNKCSVMQDNNGNADNRYIPIILKFSGYQQSRFKKSNEQIIINYRYISGIITLK